VDPNPTQPLTKQKYDSTEVMIHTKKHWSLLL